MKHIVSAAEFEQNLLSLGIKDDDCHHEFTTGVHGEKLNFDLIKPGSTEWRQWTELNALFICQMYPDAKPPSLVGIADGTTAITEATAAELNRFATYESEVLVLPTEKIIDETGKKLVRLTKTAKQLLTYFGIQQALEIDDAATSGSTTAMPISELRNFDVRDIGVLYAWLRNKNLPHLDALNVPYYGLVDGHYLPDYSPADCRDHGFCAEDPPRPLIPYGGSTSKNVV